jgi:hypothetical protein
MQPAVRRILSITRVAVDVAEGGPLGTLTSTSWCGKGPIVPHAPMCLAVGSMAPHRSRPTSRWAHRRGPGWNTGEPVTVETLFSVGSLTKPMVATVITFLAQGGRLSLDDPVARTRRSCAAAAGPKVATLRDLLANRSGATAARGSSSTSTAEGTRTMRVPSERFWSYNDRGLVPAQACDRVGDRRCLGGRNAASPSRRGKDERDDLCDRRRDGG